MGLTVGLENNSGKRALNSMEFVWDIVRGAIENRIGAVETGADDSMSNKRCSVIVEIVFDVSEIFPAASLTAAAFTKTVSSPSAAPVIAN